MLANSTHCMYVYTVPPHAVCAYSSVTFSTNVLLFCVWTSVHLWRGTFSYCISMANQAVLWNYTPHAIKSSAAWVWMVLARNEVHPLHQCMCACLRVAVQTVQSFVPVLLSTTPTCSFWYVWCWEWDVVMLGRRMARMLLWCVVCVHISNGNGTHMYGLIPLVTTVWLEPRVIYV